jgi:hypothetical protein
MIHCSDLVPFPITLLSQLLQQRCLLRRECCRHRRAPLSGPIEVLQRDERRVDARELRLDRVVERVRHLHRRVVHSVAGEHVADEMLEGATTRTSAQYIEGRAQYT